MNLNGVALGAILAIGMAGSANAAGLTFTLTPAGATPTPLVGTPVGPANNIVVSDTATITLPAGTNTFNEQGILVFQNFQNGGLPVSTTSGLNSTYSLYITFTGSGTQPTLPGIGSGSSTTGQFTSLNYALYGKNGPFTSVTATTGGTTYTPTTGQEVLAYGSLKTGTTTLTAPTGSSGYSPQAALTLSFNACTAANIGSGNAQGTCSTDESGFFTAPPPSSLSLLFGTFTADTTVTSFVAGSGGSPSFLLINGGGGNLTLAAPEPLSLSLVGSGLVGLGLLRRRKNG